MPTKNLFRLLLAAACLCLVVGCANPPVYQTVRGSLVPEPGKGLVLIYYRSGVANGAFKWHLYAKQCLTTRLKHGSFYAYQADPGPVRFMTSQNPTFVDFVPWPNKQAAVEQKPITIHRHQTYYVDFNGGDLKLVSADIADRDMEGCEWINPPGEPGHP